MSIQAIGALGGLPGPGAVGGATATTPTDPTSGAVFGGTLAGQVDHLQAMQSTADGLAVKAVTGDLNDIHDYTIAASEASVAMELTSALRNKAIEAFTEIMRMQA
ncbi:flagellar hook-basal body complex protein FliE [Isoptericola sp. b441]|uniref:Flagellar hook-basal body complex protein FliE n=1 Tax=Actinotalea lenta TaxID=3064654 RepID=A0ABT9D5P0_9CELL|nr:MULTISPECIES: flagellar hook-basal body complex protein FliE [unclassified Isoptericola]MDO8106124.1 flagellar hook-basal body complex protein FliE [Isoptericola sp. b441]MDO8122157.1 flagellar hook-basal body complex protein FliE [Isoptericola sp. b490]